MKIIVKFDVFEADSMHLLQCAGVVGESVDEVVAVFKKKLSDYVAAIKKGER